MGFKTAAKRLVPLFYFLAVSLPHHPVSTFFDKQILIPTGFYEVQHAVDIISLLLLAGILLLGVRVVRIHGSRAISHFAVWLFLLVLMYISDEYLVVNNAERIHYPQYALLALLLGLSLRSEVLIFFVASFAGFLDEFLQYAMNPSKTNYLDFNDIVLNVLGAALGVALLIGLRKPIVRERSTYERRFGLLFRSSMAAVALAVGVAFLFGRIVPLAENVNHRSVVDVVDGRLSFIMSFERHDQVWQKSYFGKVFHVFSPLEGASAILILSGFFWWSSNWLLGVRRPRKELDLAGASPPNN